MTGTFVNVAGIIAGALMGLLLKRGIPDHINAAITRMEGLAIGIIALNGIIGAMFTVSGGRLSDSGGLLLLISLVVGCLAGEVIRIQDRIEAFGAAVEQRSGAEGFSRGFVSATLVFCIGAMSIVGPLYDGLGRGSEVLFLKATLDFTTAIILAASLGIGVMFAAVPVLILQGGVSLLAMQLEPFLSSGPLLDNICMVGYAMVLCIGINFLLGTEIKVANLLPALLVPVVHYLIF